MSKRTFNKMSQVSQIALTLLFCMLFSTLLCLAFSLVASNSDNPNEHLTLYGEVCFMLSMMFCGVFGAKIGGDKKYATAFISGGVFLSLIMAMSLFFSEASFIKAVILALLGIFILAVGALLGSREKRRKKRR